MGSRRGSRNSYLDKILRSILLEKVICGQKPEEGKGGAMPINLQSTEREDTAVQRPRQGIHLE